MVRSRRLNYLDGLRGGASVAVLLWHHFLAFYPGAISPDITMRAPWLENWVYRSPLAMLFAGDWAVYVFFVLSGFVISIKSFDTSEVEPLRRAFLRRYVRLMPPAFVSIAIAYFILLVDWSFNQEASVLTNSWWLGIHWSAVDLSLKNMLTMGLYGMWPQALPPDIQFNSNLGTLSVELIGSIMVFGIIILMSLMRWTGAQRAAFYLPLFAVTFWFGINDPHYLCFFGGMVMADAFANRPQSFDPPFWLRWVTLILAIYLGSMNTGNLGFFYYYPLATVVAGLGLNPLSYAWCISAVLMVYFLLCTPWLQTLFQSAVFQFLGRFSFALFLSHTIVLCSATSFIFIWLTHAGMESYGTRVATSVALSLPFLLAFTYLLRIVDVWAIRTSRLF